jgi:hypothetical protein
MLSCELFGVGFFEIFKLVIECFEILRFYEQFVGLCVLFQVERKHAFVEEVVGHGEYVTLLER